MEVTIHYNGQAVAVEVTLEVYEFLNQADHKAENLSHEQRRPEADRCAMLREIRLLYAALHLPVPAGG